MTTIGLTEQRSIALSEVPEERHHSRIAEFYQDRAVFVTGGTGFIGKVFDRLKKEQPDALGKVRAVVGDLTEPNLGLSWADLAALIENVSVVFHAAATVKFDEPLKKAFQINVLGTRHVLDLCKQMQDFCVLVHVSTAYCNCDKEEVHEVVYPKPELPPEISEHAQCIDGKTGDSTSGRLLANHPNTYTFTKALAESLLLEERASLPVAIVRPSIVTAAWKEPFPLFNLDVRELQWKTYWDQYVLGIRRYLFHADDSELPRARRRVFDRLKREQPDALGKVRAVVGDLTEPNLGLSWADLAALIENVSVVFHAAATVKFDEPLK
ncbi:hypothetical protein HPB52_009109 [Rhipicephalus sanguineus]|uniref:Fatty acyl-CoA reductase n=1 Tax=Rhipicephalus sanguineus TaxID=34632 RepID=A0A9D4Q6E8_RHISA|nr:hypothetical protein HPB52_009109 [Rhipicephalus sanguineus]